MNKEITSVTILGEESHKEMVFIPATKKKVEIPKKSLTKEEKKMINQEIYLNCMYLKKNLAR